MSRLSQLHLSLRRAILTRRRWLAALFTAVAVLAGLHAVAAPALRTTPVLVAARDLGAGVVVRPGDLRTVGFAQGTAPAGVLTADRAVGRTTTTPVHRGEPVTDVRVVAGSLLVGYPGRIAAPVRLPDAAAVDLLRVGDRVDLLVTDPQDGGDAVPVSQDTPVIAIPADHRDQSGIGLSGRLVVLALTPAETPGVLAAGVRGYLSATLSH